MGIETLHAHKKIQTLVNRCARAAQQLRATADDLESYRDMYVAAGLDPAGTPLDGNVPAVNAWIAAVRAAADSPVAGAMIGAFRAGHTEEAF